MKRRQAVPVDINESPAIKKSLKRLQKRREENSSSAARRKFLSEELQTLDSSSENSSPEVKELYRVKVSANGGGFI